MVDEVKTTPDVQIKVTAAPAARNHSLPLILLVAALAMMFGNGLYWWWQNRPAGYPGGGAAAASGVLLIVALVLHRPALIMDDTPDAGGEPSTMRVLSLIIIVTFAAVVIRTCWNTGGIPTLKDEGNWVWLVTAALGGKALQKFAEVQENKNK